MRKVIFPINFRSIAEIFGSPDDLKLRSCATLFASVPHSGSVFDSVLEKYYHGVRDGRTLHLLNALKETVFAKPTVHKEDAQHATLDTF